MRLSNKHVWLVIFLITTTSVAFCQVESDAPINQYINPANDQNSFYAGTLAGKTDAKGDLIYGCGGFGCGVFGVLFAALSDPQPEPLMVNQLLQTQGANYASAYATAYAKETKKQNVNYSLIGWGVELALSLVYYVSIYSNTDDYDKNPGNIGISIPFGNPTPAFNIGK